MTATGFSKTVLEERLPSVIGYDFKESPEEIRTVKVEKQETGLLSYQLEFKKRTGNGSRRYLIEASPSGQPLIIEVFKNNEPSEAKAWWSNGKQSVTAEFRNFKKSGIWQFWNRDGETIGKVNFTGGNPRLIAWDKNQMAALAKVNNFYSDIVTSVVQEFQEK
jgi:antitoxin component YwqK of YwqJK toxin-antitoxin module